MTTLTIHAPRNLTPAEELPAHGSDVESIDYTRHFGGQTEFDTAVVRMDVHQALAIAYDLLYQAVDAGAIAGWNVQFPEHG